MELAFLKPQQVPVALAALQSVARSDGTLTDPERSLLDLVAEIHGTRVERDALPALDPGSLAAQVNDPHQRKRLVQMAVVMAMVDGDVSLDQEKAVRTIADALEVDEASLKVLHDVVNDSKLLTRVHMMRRIMGRFVDEAREREGLAGVKKFLGPLFVGGGEDPQLAWRYKQLGLLPEGTLGRAYWEFCTSRRFGFPGEPGGLPERMIFHDFGHVLSGYDTDAEGEMQQGAFQAGFIRTDGFSFLLFVIVQFHLGIKVTPIAEARSGLLDVRKLIRAAERGAACRDDLSARWDHWAWVEMPLKEVRARLGIPPPDASPLAA
jgi:tellurite resistance protein